MQIVFAKDHGLVSSRSNRTGSISQYLGFRKSNHYSQDPNVQLLYKGHTLRLVVGHPGSNTARSIFSSAKRSMRPWNGIELTGHSILGRKLTPSVSRINMGRTQVMKTQQSGFFGHARQTSHWRARIDPRKTRWCIRSCGSWCWCLPAETISCKSIRNSLIGTGKLPYSTSLALGAIVFWNAGLERSGLACMTCALSLTRPCC
ncbi:uncharacterized protein LY79DRAFT_32931 [Colletotrichum navitas]|uniref:Uncharacterized protein n=1 Tax=Colletotrichum navitas TaxID=681940 RepID=A0AAD8V9I8_9PEZI|nr:uncharacterized protein LY79DRAFT_32931 [Colletotrichum navitas]KAK1596841.1 hypothetical protein LY79DRAFT_32931 [Colletotrichum navitas]